MISPVPTKIIAAAIAFMIGAGVGAPRGDAARAAEPQSAGADVVAVKAVTYCFSDTIGVTGYLVPREDAIKKLDADGYRISETLVKEGATDLGGRSAVTQLMAIQIPRHQFDEPPEGHGLFPRPWCSNLLPPAW
jgi:hypothetical protein